MSEFAPILDLPEHLQISSLQRERLEEAGMALYLPANIPVPRSVEEFCSRPLNTFADHFLYPEKPAVSYYLSPEVEEENEADSNIKKPRPPDPPHLLRFGVLYPPLVEELRYYTGQWEAMRQALLNNPNGGISREPFEQWYDQNLRRRYFEAYCIMAQLVDRRDTAYLDFMTVNEGNGRHDVNDFLRFYYPSPVQ